MTPITEKNFLSELFGAIPEFKEIHDKEKEYHNIGIHLIFGDFRRLAELAVEEKNYELLKRIEDFVIRCHQESKDEVNNAVFVSFFENMNEESLKYFYDNLPEKFVIEIKKFLHAFDIASAKGQVMRLWEEFRIPFPKDLHNSKYSDRHLELMDGYVAGCISSYITNWNLELDKKAILEDFVKNYEATVKDFPKSGLEYFDKLKKMATMVLELIGAEEGKIKAL